MKRFEVSCKRFSELELAVFLLSAISVRRENFFFFFTAIEREEVMILISTHQHGTRCFIASCSYSNFIQFSLAEPLKSFCWHKEF